MLLYKQLLFMTLGTTLVNKTYYIAKEKNFAKLNNTIILWMVCIYFQFYETVAKKTLSTYLSFI